MKLKRHWICKIIFDSVSSVLSYNTFHLKEIHGEKKEQEQLRKDHVSHGGKQFLYYLLYFTGLLV